MAELVRMIGSPDVRALAANWQGPEAVSAALYREAMNVHRPALKRAYERYFHEQGVAAMIFPTTVQPALPLNDEGLLMLDTGAQVPSRIYLRNVDPGSLAGVPGITLPAGLTPAGLPVGIELDGPVGSDRRLLNVAAQVAALLPGTPPPAIAR